MEGSALNAVTCPEKEQCSLALTLFNVGCMQAHNELRINLTSICRSSAAEYVESVMYTKSSTCAHKRSLDSQQAEHHHPLPESPIRASWILLLEPQQDSRPRAEPSGKAVCTPSACV